MKKISLVFLLSMLTCLCGSKSFAQDVVNKYQKDVVSKCQKAAEQGNAEEQCKLAGFYYFGYYGVKKDSAKALYWFRKAAEQGNLQAQSSLGSIYNNDIAMKDPAKAVYWYRIAAEQGDAPSQVSLAYLYMNGDIAIRDTAKAVYWYSKAAEQGDYTGQLRLGECYHFGKGVTEDYTKAVYWYSKAAEQGVPKAKQRLKEIEEMPKIINLTVDRAYSKIVKDGVQEILVLDVDLLRINRKGKIEFGTKNHMDELTIFDVAKSYKIEASDVVRFSKEDVDYESTIIDVNNNKIFNTIKVDLKEISMIIVLNKRENIKLKNIYKLVKQNKFMVNKYSW